MIRWIFILVFLVTVGEAHAQLLMEKSRVQLTVSAGETIVDSMNIHNTGKQDVDIRVYWQDFEYIPPYAGKKEFTPPGTSTYSMGPWISYSPQVLTIPAQGKREIRYTIKVPSDAIGGHYGVLFFEQALNQAAQNTGVNVITRLGSLFYVETSDSDRSATIDQMQVDEQQISGSFSNNGNVYLFPRGVYYFIDAEGVAQARGEVKTMYLMPESSTTFTIDLPQSSPVGLSTLVVTFDLGQGDSIVKEIDLSYSELTNWTIEQVRD